MNNYPTGPSHAGQHLDAEDQARQNAALGLLEIARKEHRFPAPQTVINQKDVKMRDIDDEVLGSEAASILMTMKYSDQATNPPLNLDCQYGNVFTHRPAYKYDAGLASDDNLAFHSEDARSVNNDHVIPTLRRRAHKKDCLDSDTDDEYIPSVYQRNRLDTTTDRVRRSTRKTQQLPSQPSDAPLSLPSPTLPSALPSTHRGNTLNIDPGEGFMPSAENDFKFKYDSLTGRSAAELYDLFKLSAHQNQLPTDVRGLKVNEMKLSYHQLGAMPKPGLADELVAQMEAEHQRRIRECEEKELA